MTSEQLATVIPLFRGPKPHDVEPEVWEFWADYVADGITNLEGIVRDLGEATTPQQFLDAVSELRDEVAKIPG